ncbi:MAG: DUF2029 domain-containing protein [Candidatus Dormibacteraeota bacterium]|nr:DUF2029 domain-containing protein [Candidatus Dormibacteraeota bacterium]
MPGAGAREWLLRRLLVAWLMFAALLAVLGPIFWLYTAATGIGGLDFIAFYTSSRVFLEQGPLAVFDVGVLTRAQISLSADWGGQPFLPDLYPPFWIAAHSWLGWLPVRWAYLVWGLVTIAATGGALFALAQAMPARDRRLAMVVGAGFLPVTVNLIQGQSDAFVLLAVGLSLWLWTSGREGFAGAALGLSLIKPQLGLLLIVLPFIRGSTRAVVGLLVLIAALTVISLAVFGPSVPSAWAHLLTNQAVASSEGSTFRPWLSLRGPLVTAGLPITVQYAVLAALAVALVVVLARRRADIAIDFAAATAGALLITPHANVHDLVMLLVPGMVLATRQRYRGVVAGAYAGATAAVWLPLAAPLAGGALLWSALSRPRVTTSEGAP